MTYQPQFDIAAGEREQEALELEQLRGLSDRERGRLILSVCQSAAMILAGRLKSGLPPVTSDPWPASTWELLRKHATHAQQS